MKKFYLPFIIFVITSCGGGGGGGTTPTPPTTPTPTVNLSANPVSVLLESTSTLTWSSTNATSCSASWTSQTGSSGSEAVTISTAGNNSFSITCTGAGGSRSASVTVEGYRETDGVVVDGYISGAEICIDEDESWTCDTNESSTTSDNDGKFTIRYANGNLVSIGGTDLDSQTLLDNLLITHKLTGHSDFKAVTPVTSIAAFMADASLVNSALGIDSSIDVFTFDPVANKGDGGIYDYLYEKGNQLTVLAFALQNITNDLNTTTETTQDYFKAITEEIEKEFTETSTKVDIETEAFITKVFDNIIAAKSVTITDEAKANTAKALSGVMPVIEVKSSDDLTTSVIRFAVSTLQTDIQAIANGTASSETITSYTDDVLNYIAEDQDIDSDEITPNINAIADTASTSQGTAVEINVLLNDSYLTSSPISVTAGNGSDGATSVASNIVTYEPDADFNGTDTFSYTIIQGDKTSSATVTVRVISTESNTIFGDILPSSIEIDLTKSNANLIIEVEFEDSVGINIENLPIAEIVYENSTIDTSGIQLSGSGSLNYSKYKYLKLSQWILQSGNSNKGILRSNGIIPQYLRGGFYNINSGYFYDNNGYRKNKTQNKAIKLIVEGDAPELSNLTISSNEVDVSSEAKTITLSVNAKDVSGINLDNLPLARIDAKGGSGSINADSKWTLKSGTEYDGIFETTITISKDAVADDYLVATGNFYDVHGNLYYLLSLYGSNSGGITINSEVEGDSPELSNLTISSNEVDVSSEAKTITLTVNAKDVSGINLDNLPLARIDAKGGSGSINADSKWTLKSGTEYDGIFETTITISKDAVADDYLVATGNFYDVHGSFFYLLTGYGTSNNGINITSAKEGVIPSVSAFTVTPNKVYVFSESAIINLTIKVSDESGIDDSRLAKPSIYQQNGALSISSDKAWERTDGDIYDGAYSASIEIPKESIPGSYSINSGYFYDINNNFNYENSLYGSASGGLDIFNEDAPANIAPVFTSDATFSAAENQTAIGTVTATDADGDSVTFTVSGSELAITSAGVLTFASAPDYETKSSYTATVTATDGINLSTQNITVTITNVPDSFKGEVIDGYISGAVIFIDQNFNFNMDDGEYSATTSSDGSFNIDIDDEDVYKCLEKRSIIANVPVGAIDSTLGEVSQAYQMVLPSISDTGNTSIVISPFTSLFAEAILSSKSNIAQDLTVSEGCEIDGDNIAANISTRIDELKASIESNFGISYDQLLSDFIENPTDDVDESSAQNIAKLLPYLQIIDNQVSDYLTESFDKNIRANVSLSEDSLSTIFGGSNYEKLPLDFYSNYQTSPNSDGWYRSESLDASGAFISKDGVLSREDCSETDITLCDVTELSLNNIANTSTSYTKTSSFSKSTPVDFNELGITNGSLSVSSTISSSWRNNSENWNQPNNRSRECQKTESINFSTGNTDTDQYTTQFHYNNYSQGFEKADCNEVRHYYTPILNASTFLSDGSGSSLGAQYYIFDVLRSGISSNLPYDFVDDSVNINPELVVKDIAVLPRMYKDLDTIRALFRGDDYILFNYDRNSALAGYFEAGTNPSNDMFWNRETESSRIYGQAARTAFFNKLKEDPNLNEDFYGESAPTNTSVIGRIANSYIEITDFNGSDEIILQVTPTYDYQTQTLDYSVESSLDLDNIKDFIRNGINGNPLNAKIWYNPDGSIESTVPIKLYLYEGDDASIDANEGYFEMSFNLNVSSSSSGNTNNYEATQVWTIEENSEISVSYSEDGVTLSQTVINIDEDKITLVDSNTGDTADSLDSYINQPSNLNLKLLNLISKVSDKISGIQNFFEDGGKYTIELDLGSGGHSLVAFDRNIVKNITGTFTTKSSPTYAISVNDMIINEGDSKDICFSRSSNGDLSATEFDLSFTQRERPGKGGLADDFTLSDTTIVFDENATQSCIVFSAIKDTHFDWAHDIYLDISEPSNGQSISRSRIKITILDIYFPNRIDWRRK